MDEASVLYDDTEQTSTRFVGYVGNVSRFDLAITQTSHFYGKRLVTVIQNGRTGILGDEDVNDCTLLAQTFELTTDKEARELSEFLQRNL